MRLNLLKSLLIIFSSLVISSLGSAQAATFYISPTGSNSTGDGSSTKPWASFAFAYTKMLGGDTLIVKNGVYKQQYVMANYVPVTGQYPSGLDPAVIPPSGTASKYTIIKAETDGEVIVDGEKQMTPIWMQAYSPVEYIQIQGIIFRNQNHQNLLRYAINHVKFIKDGFEYQIADPKSSDSTEAGFGLKDGVHHVLLEDCFIWGSGRYKFIAYDSSEIVLRRTVVRFDQVDAYDIIGHYSFYSSSNIECQNCIAIDGDHPEFWRNIAQISPSAVFYFPDSTGLTGNNIQIKGSIALNNALSTKQNVATMRGISFKNSVFWHHPVGGYDSSTAVYDHMTIGDVYGNDSHDFCGNGVCGIGTGTYFDSSTNSQVHNSLLMRITGTALIGKMTEDFNAFFGNQTNKDCQPWSSNCPTSGGHSLTVDPQLKYIVDASSAGSAIQGKANDGKAIGATILKRIGVSGTLYGEPGYNTETTEDLWPWPYEEVIGRHMRAYRFTGPTTSGTIQTLSGDRGFAATGQTLTNYIWTYLGHPNPYATGGSVTPTPVTVPVAPSGLTADAVGSNQINLSFTDNSNDESGFKVDRASAGGAFTQLTTLGANVTTFSDSNLSASTQYSYRIRATNTAGDSAFTNTASATTLAAPVIPLAPTGLVATAISSSQIDLRFTDNSNNESGFKLERAAGTSTSFSQIALLAANTTSFSDKSLSASTQYSYRLRATNIAGDSSFSNTSSATTLAAAALPPPPSSSEESLFSSLIPSNPADTDIQAVELGFKFRSKVNGQVLGLRFFKSTSNTGTHIGNLWSSAGAKLASATFSNETASGWQEVRFASPVSITANTVYVASYFTPTGHYAGDEGFFASSGVDSTNLHALSDTEAGGNGVYAYGTSSSFPNSSWHASNYYVDVLFSAAGALVLPPPQPTVTAALASVALVPSTVIGGNSVQATVTLTSAAPSGGAVVTLTSSRAAKAPVPASITIPAGSTSASFTISTRPVLSNRSAAIKATYKGITKSATLYLKVAPVSTVDTTAPVITVNPTSVTVTQGSVYGLTQALQGLSATDNVDGTITSQIQVTGLPTSTATAGTFTITYNVKDAAGNAAAPKTRTLVIQSSTVTTYTITATAGANGSISPTSATVASGGSQTFTISPNSGYQVTDVLVNGVSVGPKSSHTISGITSNQTISASFSLIPINSGTAKFYVSPTGNDSGSGSSTSPLRTLQRAADLVAAGETVRIPT